MICMVFLKGIFLHLVHKDNHIINKVWTTGAQMILEKTDMMSQSHANLTSEPLYRLVLDLELAKVCDSTIQLAILILGKSS